MDYQILTTFKGCEVIGKENLYFDLGFKDLSFFHLTLSDRGTLLT